MGYRSEVAIVIEEKNYNEFMNLMKQYDKETFKDDDDRDDVETAAELFSEAELYRHVKGDDGKMDCFVLHWEDIKWYDTYRCVRFFNDVCIGTCADFNADFIRVGEDAGDIVDNSSLHSGIIIPWVEQRIELYDNGGLEEW